MAGFGTRQDEIDARSVRHGITRDGEVLGVDRVLDLWDSDAGFRSHFLGLIRDCPFEALRWETPAVTLATAGRAFEFVLVDSPSLAVSADRDTFAAHYGEGDEGVVVFDNLGGDATLVVPSPRADVSAYGHLSAFVRGAPEAQQHALLRVVSRAMRVRLSERPVWLSTAGGGVAWLHVRLDDRPKYYTHTPYRTPP